MQSYSIKNTLRGPHSLQLSVLGIILTVCFGSWLRSLGLVRAVNPDTDIRDEESLETRQTSPTGVWPQPQQHKYMQPEENLGGETKLPRNLRYLV